MIQDYSRQYVRRSRDIKNSNVMSSKARLKWYEDRLKASNDIEEQKHLRTIIYALNDTIQTEDMFAHILKNAEQAIS